MKIFGFEIIRPKKNTALHPDFKKFIEYAFEIEGVKFYHFKNYLDMPVLRYQMFNLMIREAEMRMTQEEGIEFLSLIKDALNKGKITDAVSFCNAMEYRFNEFLEVDTFYRLFSCAFFTLEEDITVYDDEYNEWKIELFKKEPQTSFFFKRPMKELLPQIDMSEHDLESFLKQSKVQKKYLQEIKSKYIEKSSMI